MKWIGIGLIVGSAGTVGFRIALSLKQRCQILNQLLQALQVLQNEIAFCGTALPQAFALMAVSVQGTLETVFSHTAREMDKHRWLRPGNALEQALGQTSCGEAGPILLTLGQKLGQYDLEAQLQGIELAREQTRQRLAQLEQERSVKARTYETLGICAGLAVAILLF